jgi:hypothetical protein
MYLINLPVGTLFLVVVIFLSLISSVLKILLYVTSLNRKYWFSWINICSNIVDAHFIILLTSCHCPEHLRF